MNAIDFWFSVGSTYSYLTIMRLEKVEASTGIPFRWRPFSVRAVMIEMDNIPFATKPVKLAYMWRDLERRAAMYGIPAKLPAPYPLKEFDLANRVAIVGSREGWCADYARATYKHWFQLGRPAGSKANLDRCLRELGRDPDRIRALANTPEIESAYEAATDEARELGVFGVPSFVVNGEIFWGDDRLEDAISWHRHGRVSDPAASPVR